MSLHALSQTLAARGRNGDSMLVHMTPGEVDGLQAIAMAAGGSLSRNPETGLPEANFLKSILPMVAGAVLTGGMGIPALASAALVGGGTALASKNLGKGLMAGLGAFGGAGIGSALSGLGATTAADATAQALAANAGSSTADALNAANAAANTAGGMGAAPMGAQPMGMAGGMQNMQSGLGAALQNPQAMVQQMGGGNAAMKTGAMAAAPMVMGTFNEQKPPAEDTSGPTPFKYEFQRTPESEIAQLDGSRERLYGRGQFTRLASGGLAAIENNPYYTMSGDSADAFKYLMGQGGRGTGERNQLAGLPAVTGPERAGQPRFSFDPSTGVRTRLDTPEDEGAAPGVAGAPVEYNPSGGNTAYAAGGRLLTGPGDGVSDSIPATIDRKTPARLATGEFVFDARTVSEIGNGDTRAGAKKLYAVMNAIQKKRASAPRGKPSGADRELAKLA